MSPGERLLAPPLYGDGPGLHRVWELGAPARAREGWARLDTLRVVGTDGKGSTCALLASVLGALGLDVALYTSPHLLSPRERFVRGGRPVEAAVLAALEEGVMERVGAWEAEHPDDRVGAFERCTLALMDWVSAHPPAVLVAEAGVGGRLDSTRLLPGQGVGLCPVDLEHAAVLGPTVEHILADKLELVPNGGWLALGAVEPGLARRARGQLQPRGVECVEAAGLVCWGPARFEGGRMLAQLRFGGRELGELSLGLLGRHQLDNAALALTLAAGWWTRRGGALDAVFADAARRGLEAARWPGRMQPLDGDTFLDLAHTPQGARAAARAVLDLAQGRPVVWVAAASAGRELGPLFAPLEAVAQEIVCVEGQERAAPAAALRAALGRGWVVPGLAEGLALARERAAALGGVVLVAGSLFAGRELLAGLGADPVVAPAPPAYPGGQEA